jgi:hypothetical protein
MPRRNRIIWMALLPVSLLALALAMLRRGGDDWEYEEAEEETTDASEPAAAEHTRRRPAARFATAAAFTALFFAGASFTAGAGDQAAKLLEDDSSAVAEQAEIEAARSVGASEATAAPVAPEEAPAEPAPVDVVTVEAPAVEAAPEAAPAVEAEAAPTGPSAAAAEAADAAVSTAPETAPEPSNVVSPAPAAPAVATEPVAAAPAPAPVRATAKPRAPKQQTKQWVVKRAAAKPAVAPEIEREYGQPTVWLNRALPDPTPASARLARSFARDLRAASRRHGADWAVVLGVLRAQGERGSVPAGPRELDALASRLGGREAWKGALAVSGRTAFADRAAALADLYRSVGLEALVTGFAAAKDRLVERLLAKEGVLVYDAGRADLEAGRIDVRIVVLLGYLAERHGSVTVSSLFSGHRRFARPGVVSAHVYGHAVDVAAVGGTPIAGHQQPGGLTEAAVRSVLLLPAELQPQQVISLLGLGGPSFPLRDHGDHIHVGY